MQVDDTSDPCRLIGVAIRVFSFVRLISPTKEFHRLHEGVNLNNTTVARVIPMNKHVSSKSPLPPVAFDNRSVQHSHYYSSLNPSTQ